jgi:hypothetical protein
MTLPESIDRLLRGCVERGWEIEDLFALPATEVVAFAHSVGIPIVELGIICQLLMRQLDALVTELGEPVQGDVAGSFSLVAPGPP